MDMGNAVPCVRGSQSRSPPTCPVSGETPGRGSNVALWERHEPEDWPPRGSCPGGLGARARRRIPHNHSSLVARDGQSAEDQAPPPADPPPLRGWRNRWGRIPRTSSSKAGPRGTAKATR